MKKSCAVLLFFACNIGTAAEKTPSISVDLDPGDVWCKVYKAAWEVAAASDRDGETVFRYEADMVCFEVTRPIHVVLESIKPLAQVPSRDRNEDDRWIYTGYEAKTGADVRMYIIKNKRSF